MISALIFDLDGTLLETEELKAMSYAHSARELDPDIDEDAVVAAFSEGLVGRSRQEVAGELIRRFGLEEAARGRAAEFGVEEPWQVLVEIRLGIYEGLLEDTDLLLRQRYPHNIALLRELRGEGYPTACATMSHLEQVQRVLSVLGLEDAFDLVATMEDVERGKPDPEIDLFVARKMGLPAEEFLVIEDSPAGVKAALAAGMAVVAVTTEFTRQAFQNSELLDRRWIVDNPGDVQGVVRERIEAAGGRQRQKGSMEYDTGDLPNALTSTNDLEKKLEGKRPAVFLDYDGTLTPIVDRPEDAVISDSMREAVAGLAERCPVCVVSGRDRPVVQELMGLDNLIVAGSHGFDIWSPDEGKIEREEDADFDELLDEVKTRVREEVEPIEGTSVEPKAASVAVHYRLVSEDEKPKVREIVDEILEQHPDDLRMTPGKMVYEIQPKIDWDKGKAVLYLLETLELDREDVVPIYIGDDVTDEDAFGAISGTGIGIFVGQTDDPEAAGRTTAADYVLDTVQDVERFLDGLAR